MKIIVSLLVVLAFGSVWLSYELDTVKSSLRQLETSLAAQNMMNERLAAVEEKLNNPFLEQDYQQLLGLLQSYLIDSHRYQELFLQHTQTSISLILTPNHSKSEKQALQEKLERIKQEALLIDGIRKQTFETWQKGMEKYEARIEAKQQELPPEDFDEQVLRAAESLKKLKEQMNEAPQEAPQQTP